MQYPFSVALGGISTVSDSGKDYFLLISKFQEGMTVTTTYKWSFGHMFCQKVVSQNVHLETDII
jgi:hypothetical protein